MIQAAIGCGELLYPLLDRSCADHYCCHVVAVILFQCRHFLEACLAGSSVSPSPSHRQKQNRSSAHMRVQLCRLTKALHILSSRIRVYTHIRNTCKCT